MNTQKLLLLLCMSTSMLAPHLSWGMETTENLTEEEQLALDLALVLSLEESEKSSNKSKEDQEFERALQASMQATRLDKEYGQAVEESRRASKNKLLLEKSKLDVLTLAASQGNFEQVEKLIAQGIGEPDYNKALRMALDNDNFDAALSLIPFADIHQQILSLALTVAIEQNAPKAIGLIKLISTLKYLSPKIFNDALAQASGIGAHELVGLLLKRATDYGSALLRAAQKDYKKVVKLLIPRMPKSTVAQILFRVFLETTPKGRKRLVKQLIKLGAAQLTLEHIAQYNFPELLDMLLEKADKLDKAVEIAKTNNQKAIVRKLEDAKSKAAGTYVAPVCPICLEEDNKTDIKTKCGHDFHQTCLNGWMENHDTCPTCREKIIK